MFATASGTGQVDVWNLNKSTQDPVVGLTPHSHAVNKLRWSADSRRLAAGHSDGRVSLIDIAADTVAVQPRDADEFGAVIESMLADNIAAAAPAQ